MWALLWKEWREQRWRLGACCLLVAGATLVPGLLVRDLGGFMSVVGMAFSITMLPILLCMGLFVGERTGKTLGALAALPVATWKPYLAKTLAGLATVVIVLSVGSASGWLGDVFGTERGMRPVRLEMGAQWHVLLASIVSLTLMLMWMLVLSMRARTSTGAGAIGVLFLAGAYISFVAMMANLSPAGWMCLHPMALGYLWVNDTRYSDKVGLIDVGLLLAMWIGTLAIPWFWGLGRFGGLLRGSRDEGQRVVRGTITRFDALLLPRGGTVRALLWKDWHEVRWYVFGVLAGLVLPVVMMPAVNTERMNIFNLVEAQLHLMIFIGSALALVVSTAPVCGELSIKLSGFWQSRPISLKQWYWSKYWSGLAVTVLCAVVPLIVSFAICYLARGVGSPLIQDIHSSTKGGFTYVDKMKWYEDMLIVASLRLSVVLPMMLAVVYSVGVLVSVLVRHTFYAAILTLTVMLTMFLLPEMQYDHGRFWNALLWPFDRWDASTGFLWWAWVPGMGGLAAGMAWLGRVAVEGGVYSRAGAEAG